MMPSAPPPAPASPWGYPVAAPQPAPYAALQRPAGYGYPPATNYAPGYYPQQPPKTGMSPASRLLLFLVLVPLTLFLVILVVKILSTLGEVTPIPQPTTVTATPTETTTTTPVNPGNYQNDDYVVPDADLYPPDLPVPDSYEQAQSWMQSNLIYSSQVPAPVRCELNGVDPSNSSKAQLQTYLNEIVGCLMRVWAPDLQAAGFNASRPSVIVYSGSGQSACGKLTRQNAFYCAGDQQIYWSMDLPTAFPDNQHDPFLPVQILAHEFGHAIQAQTGILISSHAWQQQYSDNGDDPSGLELSRRTEMQADCFAGEFLSSVQQSAGISSDEHQAMVQLMLQLGDDAVTGIPGYSDDHGLSTNRQYWFKAGWASDAVSSCNTFADDVTSNQVK